MLKGISLLSLARRKNKLHEILQSCRLCPRKCNVNRLSGKKGFCHAGNKLRINSYFAHRGEEPIISGWRGSGAVFFAHCTMKCVYCQNFKISQEYKGKEISEEKLADIMLDLQKQGCHNINLVTPTHFLPQIMEAFYIIKRRRRTIHVPIVYNTSGFERVEILKFLDGIVDIYLPDFRYSDNKMSEKYSDAPSYPKHARETIKEMWRQTGKIKLTRQHIAKKGLIVRHLVLPHDVAGTDEIMRYLAKHIGPDVYISLMAQYYPAFRAGKFEEISRPLLKREYFDAVKSFERAGLKYGWVQDIIGDNDMTPKWKI